MHTLIILGIAFSFQAIKQIFVKAPKLTYHEVTGSIKACGYNDLIES